MGVPAHHDLSAAAGGASEKSRSPAREILRFTQNDKGRDQDVMQQPYPALCNVISPVLTVRASTAVGDAPGVSGPK